MAFESILRSPVSRSASGRVGQADARAMGQAPELGEAAQHAQPDLAKNSRSRPRRHEQEQGYRINDRTSDAGETADPRMQGIHCGRLLSRKLQENPVSALSKRSGTYPISQFWHDLLSNSAGNVVFGEFVLWIRENSVRLVHFDKQAQMEKRNAPRDTGGLLH